MVSFLTALAVIWIIWQAVKDSKNSPPTSNFTDDIHEEDDIDIMQASAWMDDDD